MLSFLSVEVNVLLKPRAGIDQILALDGPSSLSNQDQDIAEDSDSVQTYSFLSFNVGIRLFT